MGTSSYWPKGSPAGANEDGLRRALEQGRAAFNRGNFFAAHEHWEDAWRNLTGASRGEVQGLIQIAAGLHHLQAGRRGPAVSLIAKGLKKLTGAPVGGLRIDTLTRDGRRLLANLLLPQAPLPVLDGLKL